MNAIAKKTYSILILVAIFVLGALPLRALAQTGASQPDENTLFLQHYFADDATLDSTEISLITCEPVNKIYALYGHTGIRINCQAERKLDIVANWGIFDMSKSFFALRFIFGLTDYSMDIEAWDYFAGRYTYYGAGIREQVINLTCKEKRKVIDAVIENFKPQNRQYRYNFFFDNCTTRARDILLAGIEKPQPEDVKLYISSSVNFRKHATKSFRKLIHEWNDTHPWARWGNDILLGYKADKTASMTQAQFLPDNLRKDFDNATVMRSDIGSKLVKESRWATPPIYDKGSLTIFDNLTCPTAVVAYLAMAFIAIIIAERRKKTTLWQMDTVLLMASGTLGLILLCMVFSLHPTVQTNAQILIFNPFALAFALPITKKLRHGEVHWSMYMLATMTLAGFILSKTIQSFAEGVDLLALFLLIVYCRRIYNAKKIRETRASQTQGDLCKAFHKK